MESLWNNIRFAVRMMLKSPGYTAVAIIALALGIGANTAIFSVVNAVMLRPLPYIDPQRLVIVESGDKNAAAENFGGMSPADFWDVKERVNSFEQFAAHSGGGFTLTGVETPEVFPGARVSANFFQTVKANPALGRTFVEEDGVMSAPDTIVLSHRLWQRRFGGDPDIIGKTLGDTGTTVIGVMPPDFKYPAHAEVWIPFSRDSGEMRGRVGRYFTAVGLLKPGQTRENAQAELQTIAANLESQYPDSNKNITMRVALFRNRLARDVKTSLYILLGAVGFVLLIACANVANILLARSASRRREMAIRLAMGASRGKLIGQLLTESLTLGLIGGAAGLLLALWGVEALIRLLPESYAYLQLQDQVRVDGAALLFTFGASLLTGLLFGVFPAWQATRTDINDWLKEGGRDSGGAMGNRTRGALVVAEIALAMILLVGAGLLLQSFVRLQRADLGFDPRNLFTVGLSIPFRDYPDDASRVQFINRIIEQVKATPGVESVTTSSAMSFPFLIFNFNVEGRQTQVEATALYDTVSPDYLKTVRGRLLAGRAFDDRDTIGSPPVALINGKLARQYFPGEDPIGKRVSIKYLGGQRLVREVVGVVGDINQGDPSKVQPQVFVSYAQQPWLSTSLVIRAATDANAARRDVQQAILAVDKKQVFSKIPTHEEALSGALAEPRLYTTLLAAFAALAVLLAAVGIYGVIAYSVAQRTREIGVRMALGAQKRDVMKLVLRQGIALALAGVAIGAAGASATTRVMKTLLFGVSATDPVTFVVIALALTGVALLACWIPARRAAKVDPMVALRCE